MIPLCTVAWTYGPTALGASGVETTLYGAAEDMLDELLNGRGPAKDTEARSRELVVSVVVVGVRARREQWVALVRSDRASVVPMRDIVGCERNSPGSNRDNC